ncbi:hypothetical protein M899_0838 [Bacteriovorax sp. BSW11_IV]|uniref:hypothetical protein n=1 Tax=Bacteriovorax sp. BSW11_IV TaxID=1353529 RepID=UPI00038A0B1C|nr:hypothetical protein [Bacteriovorax sp. BSW11_IV]EQC43002.1 hypothetical protein M899_0838 [Bacteriovorax sp. BSW11_IV]
MKPSNIDTLETLQSFYETKCTNHSEVKSFIKDFSNFTFQHSDYAQIQMHSQLIDLILDSNACDIEEQMTEIAREKWPDGSVRTWGRNSHDGVQTYIGLCPEQLQTPYGEFANIIEVASPKQGDVVVDLGAGHGRLGLVCHAYDQGIEFRGLEYVEQRVQEGNRLFETFDLSLCKMEQQDLSCPNFIMPAADLYFMYEYGDMTHVNHSLNQLQEISKNRNFRIVCRGRGSNNLIWSKHPWLTVFDSIQLENSVIYSTSGD